MLDNEVNVLKEHVPTENALNEEVPTVRDGAGDQPALDLSAIDAVVSDMDGVLWRGAEVLPGVAELFGRLRQRSIPFVLATNNSGKEAEAYAERLRGLGLTGVTADDVVTSGSVTAEFLASEYPAGTAVHVLGSAALTAVLARAGFVVEEPGTSLDVDVVVAGIDLEFTYAKLARAMDHLVAGAAFYGTNGDVSLPTAQGLAPGAGSILAALAAASGRKPTVMGKPEPYAFESAVRRLGALPERTLMIGDRLDTDIIGAQRFGMPAALVLTGVETAESAATAGFPTEATFGDLTALSSAWEKALEAAVTKAG